MTYHDECMKSYYVAKAAMHGKREEFESLTPTITEEERSKIWDMFAKQRKTLTAA